MRIGRIALPLVLLAVMVLALVPGAALATRVPAPPTFLTGNAPVDFAPANLLANGVEFVGFVADPTGDVNNPSGIQVPGMDIQGVYFAYDPDTDTLYVGVDCVGICGNTLINNVPHFGLGETFSFAFDTDNDCTFVPGSGSAEPFQCDVGGDLDAIVGVDKDSNLDGPAPNPNPPGPCFGLPGCNGFDIFPFGSDGSIMTGFDNISTPLDILPFNVWYFQSPSAAAPDFEFAIQGWSTLFTGNPLVFAGKLFLGSINDLANEEVVVEQYITAIDLESFSARAEGGNVVVEWTTGTEIDNAGFNLYRATSADGPYVQVNDSLIAAQGSAEAGASYSYVDAPGSGTFYYQLEDVDTSGASTLHGPVVVDAGSQGVGANTLYLPSLMR